MEDYRPECYMCGKKMNKKDRENAKQKQCPNMCKKCDKFITTKWRETNAYSK